MFYHGFELETRTSEEMPSIFEHGQMFEQQRDASNWASGSGEDSRDVILRLARGKKTSVTNFNDEHQCKKS